MRRFHGNYIAVGLTEDQSSSLVSDMATLKEQTALILEKQTAEDRNRRLTTIFAIGGALFAAMRLGVLAFPKIRKRRSGE